MMKPSIGMIGVGLMGHGIAWNIANAGYVLTALDHPGNQPIDDLRAMGVAVAPSIAEVVAASDIVVLCVTGSPQVEAILMGDTGVIANLRPGMIVVDCSTALPDSTERLAAAVAKAGGRFMDAAMTRLPQHARAGTLNLLIGGDPALLDQIRPLLDTFSENITHIGGAGAGHRMKLLHNTISLGFMALLGEVAAHGEKAGIDPAILIDVLAQGGGGGAALDRISPFLRTGDPSAVPFFISNAAKDLSYYRTTAAGAGAYHAIADAIGRTLEAVVADGHGQAFVPQLAALLTTQKMPEA
jgi:3-hydroxyisobutyrate dehydrogenase-like beta-hydroxyacid dehydrogenase